MAVANVTWLPGMPQLGLYIYMQCYFSYFSLAVEARLRDYFYRGYTAANMHDFLRLDGILVRYGPMLCTPSLPLLHYAMGCA